jgi:quinol monooxygenase YgiN
MTSIPPSPLFNITLFTPKPGAGDAFAALQLQGLPTFGPIAGLRTSRLFVQDGGERLLFLSSFESAEAHRAFMATSDFQAHRERLLPLLEHSESAYWRLIYTRDATGD